jgi:hypothetical protein
MVTPPTTGNQNTLAAVCTPRPNSSSSLWGGRKRRRASA